MKTMRRVDSGSALIAVAGCMVMLLAAAPAAQREAVRFVGKTTYLNNAKAVVVQGATVSLLGQPFLESIDEIVIRKSEMVLRDQRAS